MGVTDSLELARQDWFGSAGFDRDEDHWPRRWAEAYLAVRRGREARLAPREGRPVLPRSSGWAERGGYTAGGHGNSVPRFHITWGTGPGVLAPFIRRVPGRASTTGLRHDPASPPRRRADRRGRPRSSGVRGAVLADDQAVRGAPSNRDVVGEFELRAPAVDRRRAAASAATTTWSARPGPNASARRRSACSPASPRTSTDGCSASPRRRARTSSTATGCGTTPRGSRTGTRCGQRHGIRILPGPSSLWLDASGERLPAPLFPGLRHPRNPGAPPPHRVTTTAGSCSPRRSSRRSSRSPAASRTPTSPDKDLRLLAKRVGPGAPGPVEAFKEKGADFVVARHARRTARRHAAPVRGAARHRARRPRTSGSATASSTTTSARTLQITAIRGARALPRRQADPGGARRTSCSIRRPGR